MVLPDAFRAVPVGGATVQCTASTDNILLNALFYAAPAERCRYLPYPPDVAVLAFTQTSLHLHEMRLEHSTPLK